MNMNSTTGMTTSRSWPVLVATLVYLSHFMVWALFTGLVIYGYFDITLHFPGVSPFARGLLAGVAFCFIALGFPLNPRATSPAPRLRAKDQPRLFERLRRIAWSCGQPVPVEVELTIYPTISVSQPGIDGRGRKAVIEVGLPLFHLLTVSQMEAVLAHAMFFCRRRNRIALYFLQRTRRSRTTAELLNWSFNRLKPPFLSWFCDRYARLCSRVIRSIVSDCRLAGDRCVARAVGSNIWAGALTIVVENQVEFFSYLKDALLPLLDEGCQPPLMEGFQIYVKAGVTDNVARYHHDDEEPKLQQRLAAIEHLPVHAAEDSNPAISLLDNVPELEALAISAESKPPGKKLRLMPWGQIGQFVMLPKWEDDCARRSGFLETLTLEQLPQAVANDWHRDILPEALGLLLSREGWYIDYGPGYLRMCRGEETIIPGNVIKEMAKPEFTGEKWLEMLKQWKLDPALPLRQA
jgi:hypothetical protein